MRNAESFLMAVGMEKRDNSRAFRKDHQPHLVIGLEEKGGDKEGSRLLAWVPEWIMILFTSIVTIGIRIGLGKIKLILNCQFEEYLSG